MAGLSGPRIPGRERRQGLVVALTVLGITGPLAPLTSVRAQREPYAVDSARVEVRAWRDSSRVRARYWFARPVRALDFTYLSNACSAVTDVTGRRGTLRVAFATDTNVPWVVLHDTTDGTASGELPFTHEITYRVDQGHAERLAIPIVQPAGALGERNAPVTPRVHVSVVREEPSIGEPQLPRFAVQGPDRWSTSIIAVPATVVLGSEVPPDATPCPDGIRMVGENGGFVRLVALFVATIALWIPLYFWWAGRRRPGEEEAP